jgi:hypothetical protein
MRLFVFLGLAALSVYGATESSATGLVAKLPLRFEQDSKSAWVARSYGFVVGVKGDSAVVRFGTEGFRVRFDGADPDARFAGEMKSSVPNNYFIAGNSHSAETFLQLRREKIYPGIDLVYYGVGQSLEYDFRLAPGADTSQIRMRFEGAQSTRLSEDGSVVLTLRKGEITQRSPITYQRTASGELVSVPTRYIARDDGTYSLKLADHDASRPLVIDPQILFTYYIEGTGADAPLNVALDKNGFVYIAGYSYSYDYAFVGFPVTPSNSQGLQMAVITKMDPLGSPGDPLLYSGYFSGSFGDIPLAATADADGVVYITGVVDDKFFPVTGNAFYTDNGDTRKIFVSAIDTNLQGTDGLIYSTFFGGNLTNALADGEQPTAIALGPTKGQVYITGFSSGTDYPVKNPIQGSLIGQYDGIIAEFDITKSGSDSLVASTYLGGSLYDIPRSIAVGPDGAVYIAGYTYSSDYPMSGDANQGYNGGSDAFLSKVDLLAPALEYSTFLGGSQIDQAWKVLLDPNGRVAVAGFTQSSDFPLTSTAVRTVPGGDGDAFLTIFNLNKTPGQMIDYSTLYGGNGTDVVYDMRIGGDGSYYLGGYTLSNNLPAIDAFQPIPGGGGVAGVVAIINPALSGSAGLTFSSYVAGPGTVTVRGIEVDSEGNVYVVGQALDNAFPQGYAVPAPDSGTNIFVLIFHPSPNSVVRRSSTSLPPRIRTRN